MAEVDNIEAVRKNILKFEKEGDFFVVHIIRRKKDESGGEVCGDDDARLIKTYYIDNLEYFDRKIPAIKNLCVLNSARAYILPYRRNKLTINRAMLKKVVDEIDNAHVRYDHIVRTSVCGCHVSDRKLWVVDVDRDDDVTLCQELEKIGISSDTYGDSDLFDVFVKVMTCDIRHLLRKYAKDPKVSDEVFVLKSKSGCHIITPPFTLEPSELRNTAIKSSMVKKDGMTVLYIPDFDNKEREIGSGEMLDKVLGYLADHHSDVHAEIMSKIELLRKS